MAPIQPDFAVVGVLVMGASLAGVVAFWRTHNGARAEMTDAGEVQLRAHVEAAWAEVSDHIDRLVGSGRMLERNTLIDLARFLESAMPAVGAYERLVARVCEQALADAGVSVPHLVLAGRPRADIVPVAESSAPAPVGDAQLRAHVEAAWAEISDHIDRLVGSGRMLEREILIDLARFLESAMPAVGAYERLVAQAYEQALVDAGVAALPVVVER